MDAKHTPTPWKMSLTDDTMIIYADQREVCAAAGDYNQPDEWPLMEANAAFIVTAVNSHAALESRVKALREALTEMITHFAPPVDESEWPDAHERHALRIARAALKESSDA